MGCLPTTLRENPLESYASSSGSSLKSLTTSFDDGGFNNCGEYTSSISDDMVLATAIQEEIDDVP